MTGNSSKSWSSCILSPSLSSPCCRLLVSILLLSSEATRLMKTVLAWPLSPMSLAFYSIYKLQGASDEVRELVGSNQQPRSIISDSSGFYDSSTPFFLRVEIIRIRALFFVSQRKNGLKFPFSSFVQNGLYGCVRLKISVKYGYCKTGTDIKIPVKITENRICCILRRRISANGRLRWNFTIAYLIELIGFFQNLKSMNFH